MNRNLKNGRALSYEAVAHRLWKEEGQKGKPLTKEGIRRIEQRALEKVKLNLAGQGYGQEEVLNYLSSLSEPGEYEVMR